MNPTLNFRRRETVRAGLVRIADSLIGEAVERIQQPFRNREEDLHQVRVSIKYLRAILRLVQPTLGNAFFKRENARLGSAAKRLAPLRDIAVARSTIRKALKKLAGRKDRDAFRTALRRFDEKTVKRLNMLQDYLGAEHDCGVLQSFLLGDPTRYGGRGVVRRITRYLEKRRRKLKRKSETLGKVVFAEKPNRFAYGLRKRWNEWHTVAK